VLAVSSLVLSGLGAAAAVATPVASPVVTGHGTWYTQAYDSFDGGGYLTPQQADAAGPQRAPFGPGSHQITIGESSSQTELYRTNDYDGVKLAELTRLAYSTYAHRTAGTVDRQPTYLRLTVDSDGAANGAHSDTSLFFFPANNGAVANDVWQSWNVGDGQLNEGGDGGPTTTLASYVLAHPDATLVNNRFDADHDGGSLSLVTGGSLAGATDPQVNGQYAVDRVIVGKAGQDTLYDFGPRAEGTGTRNGLTVNDEMLQGWVHQAYDIVTDTDLATDQRFVQGPGTTPAGVGSLHFSLSNDTNPNRIEQFRTPQYDDRLLRDVRTLDFSTLQRPTAPNAATQQPAYLRLNLDTNGDGTRDHSLYYYPGNNGVLQQNTWQSWHAASGQWGVDGDAGPGTGTTLQDYVVAHPDARIVNNADGAAVGGGVAFLVGGGGDAQSNGDYYLDDITIGLVDAATGSSEKATDFDLEPSAPSVSIGDAHVVEGNHGATLTFPVTLSGPAGRDITVHYATADGTAKAGKDYTAASGTVTVPAKATAATVEVHVLSDMVRENTESLKVTISGASYGAVADGSATGTINDDDTLVGISLSQGSAYRVRAHVDTLPVAKNAPVNVYRVGKAGRVRVLSAHLNSLGRISALLAKHYEPGTKLSFVATVRTSAGLYTSRVATITIRR